MWTELDAASNRYPEAFIDHRRLTPPDVQFQGNSEAHSHEKASERMVTAKVLAPLYDAHVVCMCAKHKCLIIKQTTHVPADVNNS